MLQQYTSNSSSIVHTSRAPAVPGSASRDFGCPATQLYSVPETVCALSLPRNAGRGPQRRSPLRARVQVSGAGGEDPDGATNTFFPSKDFSHGFFSRTGGATSQLVCCCTSNTAVLLHFQCCDALCCCIAALLRCCCCLLLERCCVAVLLLPCCPVAVSLLSCCTAPVRDELLYSSNTTIIYLGTWYQC